MIKEFVSYYKPHKIMFIADMCCALTVAACDLFYPTIARNIIDDYVPNQNMQLLLVWGFVLLGIYILKAGMNYFIQYYGHVVGVSIQADMRRDLFKRLQKLPFSFFDKNKTGTIMSRIINDLVDIAEFAHHGPEDFFLSLVMLIGSFIILARINPLLTIIIFSVVPFILLYGVFLRKKMSSAFTKTREEIAEVNANIENAISGMRVSRSYSASRHETEKFDYYNNRFQKARGRSYQVMGYFFSGMNFFIDFMYFLVLVAGGIFFFMGKIEPGEFTAYLLYIHMFLKPINKLVGFYEQFQNGMTGFRRFQQIMAENTEPEDPDAVELKNVKGEINFDRVSFSYETDQDNPKDMVIQDLSLHIEPGKTVALVGPSGGGKTTLCHLIPRFYEINSGEISIDGQNITHLTRESLRKNIGMVAQDVFLFTGTIRENIAYGNLDASDEQIMEAARKANIHDFIMTLPDGYDTYIGERGVRLSGGQKQRVSIARVFLKNPSILILDEATSALDNATEMLIQEALEKLSAGRTCIVVAHRLSTIKNADEIIVLTDEGIQERGSHDDLLAAHGLYSELYQYQFRH